MSPADRARVAAEIIAPGHLEAEQAGYVDTAAPVPRLDMMGGEFCVNATRAFAALLAEEGKLSPESGGLGGIVSVSGMPERLRVRVRRLAAHCFESAVLLDLPQAPPLENVAPGICLVRVPGIAHLVLDAAAHPLPADKDRDTAALFARFGLLGEDAAGCIWLHREPSGLRITPFVWVRGTGTTYAETACGSGTLAASIVCRGVYGDGGELSLMQPGGEPLAALQENADFKERLAAIELQARNAYGNFLNPLAIFLSGLGYLRENDWENAYIDFKRLYEAMPDNELIRKYKVTDLQQTRRPVPAVLASVEPFRMALDRSSVYLIFANGRGAAFTEKKYEITVPYLGYTGIAFPVCEYYPRPFGKVAALTGSDWTETVPVADMDAIVSQEYTERLPAMITRLVVNYLVKETASLLISQSASTADEAVRYLTYFGTGIYKYLFNTADTRSWELLPGEFQIGQLPMPSDHRLEVQLLAPDGRTVLRQTTVNFGEQCRSAIVYVNAPSQKNWDCLVLEFYDQ